MSYAIILAAGSSSRMSTKTNKIMLPVAQRPLLYYTLMAYNDHPEVSGIIVVTSKELQMEIKKLVKRELFNKVKKVVLGGDTRQKSLEKGVRALPKDLPEDDPIVVHNGANPLVGFQEISQTIKKTEEVGACISGHFVTSTIKEVEKGRISKTHDRKKLFAAETPQAGRLSILRRAIHYAKEEGLEATDESMLFEAIQQPVGFVEAGENNFKVTTNSDYKRLKSLLEKVPDGFLVGVGQDSHAFDEKKKGLVMAGVKIKKHLRLKANSDGDVVLHAVFNAISQALGERSLGFYADKECKKGVTDSKEYLKIILKEMKKRDFRVNSLGLMLECKTPKIDPLAAQFKENLSEILDLSKERIGVTATSGEGLTAFGEGRGIQCLAIVSLVQDATIHKRGKK